MRVVAATQRRWDGRASKNSSTGPKRASYLQQGEPMRPPMLKVALWTSSVGFALFLARRVFGRRESRLDVGTVSDDWLSHQRGVAPADPYSS